MLTQNTHFAIGTHVLVALAFHEGRPVPSAQLAGSVQTNPAFLRAVLGSLRKAGLVQTQRGKGGGFLLGRTPDDINLAQVYAATGGDAAMKSHSCGANSECFVARCMADVMKDVSGRLEQVVNDELSQTTIAKLQASMLASQTASNAPQAEASPA